LVKVIPVTKKLPLTYPPIAEIAQDLRLELLTARQCAPESGKYFLVTAITVHKNSELQHTTLLRVAFELGR